jgi:hypothetical protein
MQSECEHLGRFDTLSAPGFHVEFFLGLVENAALSKVTKHYLNWFSLFIQFEQDVIGLDVIMGD